MILELTSASLLLKRSVAATVIAVVTVFCTICSIFAAVMALATETSSVSVFEARVARLVAYS